MSNTASSTLNAGATSNSHSNSYSQSISYSQSFNQGKVKGTSKRAVQQNQLILDRSSNNKSHALSQNGNQHQYQNMQQQHTSNLQYP